MKLHFNDLRLIIPVAEDVLEVETRDNFNSLHLEGEDEGDYYTSQEHQHQNQNQHQQQEYDDNEDYEDEPQVEDQIHNHVDYVQEPLHHDTVEYVQEPLHQDKVEYVQEQIPAVEKPAPEPVKFTYASIVSNYCIVLLFTVDIMSAH